MPANARAQATARFADAPDESAAHAAVNASGAAPPAHVAVPPSPSSTPPEPAKPVAAAVPGLSFSRRLAQSHFERATALEERGDLAQALSEYTRAVSVDSTFGEAYLRLAALRERMGDPREADRVYSVAVQLTDTRARALVGRSHLRRAVGLEAEALRDLEVATELDDSPALLAELARDYVELHAWSAALSVYRRIATRAAEREDAPALETARLEVRALRVLASETDPTLERGAKHDWVGAALRSIARR